jgi:hypothetical protein
MQEDSRLTNQMLYLGAKALYWKSYKPYSEQWEHDHCSFCWEKFSLADEDLHEGYTTEDEYYWVCKPCFDDFKETFRWSVTDVQLS